jgi:hypothetical protein
MAAWPLRLGELAFREFRRFCVLTPPVLVLIPLASRTVPLSLSMAAPKLSGATFSRGAERH